MAFAQLDSTNEPRSFCIGPLKMQILSFTVASGDTSGTVTADKLNYITDCIVCGGVKLTAVPTLSGNTATLAFTDPATTQAGAIIVFGK